MRDTSGLQPRWVTAAFLFGAWTLLGLTFASLSYAMAVGEGRPANVWNSLSTNLTRAYIWAALTPLVFSFTRRFPPEVRPLRLRNLSVHIPALLLFSCIHQAIYKLVMWQLDSSLSQRFSSVLVSYRTTFLGNLYFNLLMFTLIVIASQALLYYRNYKAGEAKETRLKAQLAQAELRALKMQLHPHFLFNTLHSISALVLEDPRRANQMIARLGDFLRLTLETSEHQTVELKREIEFMRCYLEIEQVRFQDRLSVRFNVEPSTLWGRVPHLILQPVIENAIRHGVAPSAAQSHIEVVAERIDDALQLEVRDDGPGISTDGVRNDKQGLGLANVRARLEQIYGDRYRFEIHNKSEGGLAVSLLIPFESETAECADTNVKVA